jgi:pimeloyl-ACP methyl ester carboxylesterase
MATYVIVHGGFAGAYQWQEVASLLRAQGHTVFTPTLTGLGERVHLAHPGVDLDLHVLDILNVLKYEKLSDVILCAHSYGGMVITRVAAKAAGLLRRLVYIDALAPREGESAWDLMSASLPASALNAIRQAVATAGEGWRWPAAPVRTDGVPWPEVTAQPMKTSETRLSLRDSRAAALPRTYIYCTNSPDNWGNKPVIAACAAQAREAGWAYYELPTSHAVFATMPKELTAILAALA